MTTTHGWDPDRYLLYADERGRPFVELVARVGAVHPVSVLELGCGPGSLTALLAERWPRARVADLDASEEMVARAAADHPGLEFAVADLRAWLDPSVEIPSSPGTGEARIPREPVDVLVSNATLQWVPGHLDLLPAMVRAVRPSGWLALQVPGNFDEPSHTIRAELADDPRFADHTRAVAAPSAHDAATYLRELATLGCVVDAWETTYLHVLTGEDPVFPWVSGPGPRPTLQALPDGLREEFEDEFKARLGAAYPTIEYAGRSAVVLPFRRVFVVARTPMDVDSTPTGARLNVRG